MKKKIPSILGALAFSIATLVTAPAQTYQARNPDPWLDPFTADSIWNTPIGSGAVLVDASSELGTLDFINPDRESNVRTTSADPLTPVYQRGQPTNQLENIPIPIGFRPNSNSNRCVTFLDPNARSITQFNIFDLDTSSNKYFGFEYATGINEGDLYGDGRKGGHGGSGLSNLGGSIRPGELTGNLNDDTTIEHAIKVEVNWNQLFKNPNDSTNGNQTFRWPADRSDGGSAAVSPGGYTGTISALREGSLLTVASNYDPMLSTEPARKLFYAIKNYGMYIVDTYSSDSAIKPVAQICLENEEAANFSTVYGYSFTSRPTATNPNQLAFFNDLKAIWSQLKVVDNNGVIDKNATATAANLTPETIGGGGIPRVPYKDTRLNGQYLLRNKYDDNALQVSSVTYTGNPAGKYVVTYPYTSPATTSQRWQIVPTGTGYFKLTSASNGNVLRESAEQYTGNPAGYYVITYPNDTSPASEWSIRLDQPGYYRIINRNSGRALHRATQTLSTNNLANYVIGYTNTSTSDVQRWQLTFQQP